MAASDTPQNGAGRRVGQVVHLKPSQVEAYKKCHAEVWPAVLEQIHASNIRDYAIFFDGTDTLFATFLYVGSDWDGDMKRMAANPIVQEWWRMTDNMQESLLPGATGSADGPWWKELEQVFYQA